MTDTADTPAAPLDAPEMVDLTAARDIDAHGLKPMERAFCEAALDLIQSGEKHWRKKAAERAGYKAAPNAAYELCRRPHVIAFMSRSLTDAAETVKVDRSFILFRAMTNMAACEGQGDFRTAARYLETIAKHVDVGAFAMPAKGEGAAAAGHLSLPFDPANLTKDELSTMIVLMRKAGGGQPTE